jgi:hypothetical protein
LISEIKTRREEGEEAHHQTRRRREGREKRAKKEGRKEAAMGFLVISLYYLLTALVGSLLVRVCYNKGKSTNM